MKYVLISSLIVATIWIFSGSDASLPTLTNHYNLKDTIELPFGAIVSIGAENLHLSFDKVEDESRCPTTWDCLWEGVANVRFTLRNNETDQMVELSQKGRCEVSCGNWKSALGYHLQLVDVSPYPNGTHYENISTNANFDNYIAKLVVSKSPKVYSASIGREL